MNKAVATPQTAIQALKEGNFRFVNGMMRKRNLLGQVRETSRSQKPFAAIVSCMDSRTPCELIFDQGLGDIFSIRIAGNVITPQVLGSLEYACAIAGASLILVMGHTHCGAINGACNGVEMGHLTELLSLVNPAIETARTTVEGAHGSSNPEFVHAVTLHNIQSAAAQIEAQSEVLAGLVQEGSIGIASALYDVGTGRVHWL